MSNFLIGPNPCHECGGEYGEHCRPCSNHPGNQPPSLTTQLEMLSKDPRPDDQRLQILIHLTKQLAEKVENL